MPTNILTLNEKQWIVTGTGDPEGRELAPTGSLYLRDDGTGGQTLYAKESGEGATGWRAIGPINPLDLRETQPSVPPTPDTVRLAAADQNGYTQLLLTDSAGHVLCPTRDSVLIGKVAEPAGMTTGQVAYISGASGANALLRLAKADDPLTMPAVGFVMDNVPLNAYTRVLQLGRLTGLDTTGLAEGTRLFLSHTVAGACTLTPPPAPAYLQRVALVTREHNTNGELLVQVTAAERPLSASNFAPLDFVFAAGPGQLDRMTPMPGRVPRFDPDGDKWEMIPMGGYLGGVGQDTPFNHHDFVYARGSDRLEALTLYPRQAPRMRPDGTGWEGFFALGVDAPQVGYLQPNDFVFGADQTTVNRLAAVPGKVPRVKADGTGWEMADQAVAAWVNVPFNAGDFVGVGGAWTVTAGNVLDFSYIMLGPKVMSLSVTLSNTTIAAGLTSITIKIPNGKQVARHKQTAGRTFINPGSPTTARQMFAIVYVDPSAPTVVTVLPLYFTDEDTRQLGSGLPLYPAGGFDVAFQLFMEVV